MRKGARSPSEPAEHFLIFSRPLKGHPVWKTDAIERQNDKIEKRNKVKQDKQTNLNAKHVKKRQKGLPESNGMENDGKCGVWSVKCGAWNVDWKVWSVEWKLWIAERGA